MERNKYHDIGNMRRSWTGPVALIAILALIGVSVWGYYQNRQLKDYEVLVGNQYNRAFLDLTNYVDNVEVLLAKSLITSTPVSTSGMLEEVWRQANLAQTNIGQLPIAPPVLEKTSNFLTQAGDMAYALNTKTMNGSTLSEAEYQNLKKMHGFAVSLQKSLSGIESKINAGERIWGKGTSGRGFQMAATQKASNPQTSQIENIDKNFQEYPSLIYDGPYSDHMLKSKPLGLPDNKVTAEQARDKIIDRVGKSNIKEVKQLESRTGSGIETYRFQVIYQNNDTAEIEITKQGGMLYWMLKNRAIGKVSYTMEKAKEAASSFLTRNGIKDMVDTYYEKTDGIAVISYQYKQNNVIVYPDLIKVKVALDNGEILGVESKGYLYNHRKRDLPKPKLTVEEARKKINNKINITSQGMAIIPTDFKTEKFCYEFKGKVDDRNFIIYINAQTGAEEDVLMLIINENGQLTM